MVNIRIVEKRQGLGGPPLQLNGRCKSGSIKVLEHDSKIKVELMRSSLSSEFFLQDLTGGRHR